MSEPDDDLVFTFRWGPGKDHFITRHCQLVLEPKDVPGWVKLTGIPGRIHPPIDDMDNPLVGDLTVVDSSGMGRRWPNVQVSGFSEGGEIGEMIRSSIQFVRWDLAPIKNPAGSGG